VIPRNRGKKINAAFAKACQKHIDNYETWLRRQPLSDHTRRAYRSRINHFLGFLATSDEAGPAVFKDENEKEMAIRDYKRHLKKDLKLRPATVNAAITSLDHFFQYLGLDPTAVKREELPAEAPRALSKDDQRKFQKAIDRCRRKKDKAVITLLLHTGIRISECAALDVGDISITGRKDRVIIRSGKGDQYREIPLNAEARESLREWYKERAKKFDGKEMDEALFLNPQGRRISTSALDLIVRKVGNDCGLELSAHILRHSCLTNLIRNGNDLVLVSEIGGHKRLETTRRYTRPSAGDKETAMASLVHGD
jgi:site-specific recombinase XerD